MAVLTQHQPKSDHARQAALMNFLDLQQQPLGTKRGEDFGMPINYRPPPARIYVCNLSGSLKWKRAWIPVSRFNGAEEALKNDKDLARVYNVDTLYREVDRGRDMSRYRTEVYPVRYSLRVGGEAVIIPPAETPESEPPKVEVAEGAWDLYLGNYERMRGIKRDHRGNVVSDGDQTVMSDERARLAVMWRLRHNPVLRYVDDGETTEIKNEFGFLEFIREPIRRTAEVGDREFLSAIEIMES